MSRLKDLTGQRFGRLVVTERSDTTKTGKSTWLCKCDCGNTVTVVQGSLSSGNTESCGCFRKELMARKNWKHGFSNKERLNGIWQRMKQRCSDPNCADYPRYGGRGITVCDEWKESYVAFRVWALSNGYRNNLTIERKDFSGNYCPENCTWIPHAAQARNKSNNHSITSNGQTKTLAEWAEITGLDSSLIRYRLKAGWTVEDALTLKPCNSHKGGSHNHETYKAA